MPTDLISHLREIILEIERRQQTLLRLRDQQQRWNAISSDELGIINGALEELNKCRLTLDDFRNKIFMDKIQAGEATTDK